MGDEDGRNGASEELERGADDEARADVDAALRGLPPRYEPNAVLRWLYRRFFDAIAVDPAWVATVRKAAEKGTVVYALRNLSLLDFLALDHFTKRFGLPQVRFSNDLGLWILEPMGKGVSRLMRPRTRDDDLRDLRAAIEGGASASLFLKRPPNVGRPSASGRGLLEGDDFVRTLIELARERKARGDERPIVVVPQLFVWTRRPDRRERGGLFDALLGTREWPSAIRALGQFLFNYRDVTVRAGEVLDLSELLEREAEETAPAPPPSDEVLVRRAIYVLLRRLERERRVIVGPAVKPADRVVDEVVRTPRVRAVIDELAGEGKPERLMVEAQARAMLREIAAALEPEVIRAIGVAMSAVYHRVYDGLVIDQEGVERLRQAAKRGTLILLPSHKSHMDYIFVSYVLWKNDIQVPLIAAGDNLGFFPLGTVFRRAGAFFIRRKIAGDRLYQAVLDGYVHKIVREGFSLEFFLEGGRSRTGKLLTPKLGLLGMVVDAAMANPTRPTFFVPISIGYERIMEAKSYVRELSGGEKEAESVAGLVKAATVLAERYGRINLQIGQILTLDDVVRDLGKSEGAHGFKRALVGKLGYQVVYEINRATLVTPGSLVALSLLSHGARGVPRPLLVARAELFLRALGALGARLQPSLVAPDGGVSLRAIDEALGLFVSAGWLEIVDDAADVQLGGKKRRAAHQASPDAIYALADDKRMSVEISKNVILHFFVPWALICTAAAMGSGITPEKKLRERVLGLSRLFKHEFLFRANAPFDAIFDETLEQLLARGVLARRDGADGPHIALGDGPASREEAEAYAAAIGSFIEGYRVAARTLGSLAKGGGATQKELVRRALGVGKRMVLAGEIARREAVSRPVLENAFAAFLDQGYLARAEGKLVLSPSFATNAGVSAIERRIASYLARPSAEGIVSDGAGNEDEA